MDLELSFFSSVDLSLYLCMLFPVMIDMLLLIFFAVPVFGVNIQKKMKRFKEFLTCG